MDLEREHIILSQNHLRELFWFLCQSFFSSWEAPSTLLTITCPACFKARSPPWKHLQCCWQPHPLPAQGSKAEPQRQNCSNVIGMKKNQRGKHIFDLLKLECRCDRILSWKRTCPCPASTESPRWSSIPSVSSWRMSLFIKPASEEH